jgi:hypothetical protein
MRTKPPAAKAELDKEYTYTYKNTYGDAGIAIKSQSPVIKQESPY